MMEMSTSSLRTRRAPTTTTTTPSKTSTPQQVQQPETKVHSKPPLSHRFSIKKKHVLLAVAAGAWCLLSVSLLLAKVGVTLETTSHFSSNALFQAPPQLHPHSHKHNNVYHTPPNTHDPSIPLDWNPTRALHTLQETFQPPFQFAMRDLARRVLSRHVANSNVLVIAPDAQEAMHYTIPPTVQLDSVEFDSTNQLSLGGTFVLHAQDQGHETHAMNAGLRKSGTYSQWNTTLDTWWSSYDTNKKKRRPNWILLAVMDPGLGWEDVVWRDSQRFLQESTMTYIVIAVRSRLVGNTLHVYGMQAAKALLNKRYKLQVLQTSHYHVEFDANGKEPPPRTFDLYGPNSLHKSQADLEALLRWGALAAKRYSNTTSPVFTAYLFGTQGLDLAIPSRRQYIDDKSRNFKSEAWTQINLYKPVVFKPCPKPKSAAKLSIEFDKTNEKSDVNIWLYIGKAKPSSREFKFPLSPWSRRMRGWSPLFRKFQNTWREISLYLHYYNDPFTKSIKGLKISSGLDGEFVERPTIDERGIETHFVGRDADGTPHDLQLWYDGNNPRHSEAACVRYKDVVTCDTRVIYTPNPLWRRSSTNQLRKSGGTLSHNNLDLLVIMLDPMSRGQLHRSMPQTKTILEELDFLQFTQYSAVGDNSGPNQAALYSGKSLADRDGIANDGKSEWLWDTLRKAGYATLKGEDGCIENSNMLQSLKPDTSHGEALNQMFCFDFNRPNCIGTRPAASYLLAYGRKFIDTYGGSSPPDTSRQPWAAFLHFVDSHEDTSTLSTLLDLLLADFLRDAFESGKLDNAMVMMISDHGLHYGPYFQTLSGRRERTEPLLYIRTPPSVRNGAQGSIMKRNAHLWTTPFDVHQTMIDATVGRRKDDETPSLFTPLPDTRTTCRGTTVIPERFCDLHDIFNGNVASGSAEICPRTPRPPSILSFYADIPRDNRPILLHPNCTNTCGAPMDFESGCKCATSHRDWFPCKEHPWGTRGINSTDYPDEYFAIVKCPNRVERLDNRVVKRQDIVDRYRSRTSDAVSKAPNNADGESHRSPDILFLEIDSISKAYGERHLPLTMEFMRKHKIRRDEDGEYQCANGLCAIDFETFGVVGANSVANQVPVLSGCVVSRFHESCFGNDVKLTTDKCLENGLFGSEDGCQPCPVGKFPIDPLRPCNTTTDTPEKCCTSVYPKYNASRICRDETLFENGLQLFRRGPRRHTSWCPTNKPNDKPTNSTPWLFDVARAKGYITYFGEEFCYDGSPYVTQENTFPLSTDFELRNVYCRLQSCKEDCEGPWPPMGPHICAQHDGENPAFAQLESMWNAYPDVPKFAFLNAIAAHDYDFQWIKMISSIEEYDLQVVSFLERITSSKNFENTIIVARADHGLQGGPTTVEYSLQVEHREPWTQILIPKRLAGDSLKVLETNQNRLATGFDLYHTIRNLMSSPSEVAPLPSWTYDLLHSEVPADRSCQDAKIPRDFCPCEGAGLDRAPHFGVCNVFEPYCDKFCASDLDPPEPPDVIEGVTDTL